MSSRVIKDTIWASPILADLSEFAQDQFPRWLLMSDDWGCFNSDSRIVKGQAYPLRDKFTVAMIDKCKRELYEKGLLFLWHDGKWEWGYFTSWEENGAENFCNRSNLDDDGKNLKHRRKTPEPPKDILNQYLNGARNFFVQVRTPSDEIRVPVPVPVPVPNLPPSGGVPSPTLSKLSELWNEVCPDLAKVLEMSEDRKAKERARLKEHSDLAWWRKVFERIHASKFCRGETDRGSWRADFDWIIANGRNCLKVLEGKYDCPNARAGPALTGSDLWLQQKLAQMTPEEREKLGEMQ